MDGRVRAMDEFSLTPQQQPPKEKRTTKSNGVSKIPEDIQSSMRQRLRLLRESRGISAPQIQTVSSGAMTTYELHDISPLRLGDLMALAEELHLSPKEFITYLLDGANLEIKDDVNQRRLLTYFNRLSANDQELACDLVRTLMSDREKGPG